MAVRPLVTTGAALLSAAALITATPALFVPRDQVTVAAPTALAPTQLTQEQINLLALSLQGAWQAFTQGYGGYAPPGQVPATAYLDPNGQTPAQYVPGGNAPLYDAAGNQLFLQNGVTPATTGDLSPAGDSIQFYDNNGAPALQDAPGDCTATGAVCQKGFTGLAYYLSDELLPLGNVDNIFFEGGFTELAQVALATVAHAIDQVVPRLDLEKRVNDFFDGGATKLVGNLLLDNLPQDGYAYGVTNSFFFGYGTNTGIYAAFTYVVDAIVQGTPTPDPNAINPLGPAGDQVQTLDSGNENTLMLAKTTTESTPTSTGLPNFSKLLNLPTPKLDVESPWKKLTEQLGAPVEPKLVKNLDVTEQDVVKGTENPVEGGAATLVAELPTPEPPKFELPKAPEFKPPEFKAPELPELKAPETKPDFTPKSTVRDKEVAAEENPNKGSDPKGGNKVTPTILFGDGGPKGESNGSKFLKKLDKAFNDATGAGKDKDNDKGDSGDK